MKRFSALHPVVLFVYFCAVLGVAMFCLHPFVQLLSFAGGLLLWRMTNSDAPKKQMLFPFMMIPLGGLINPLFSHYGQTVLFFLNNNPVTLEAVYYGLFTGVMLGGVLLWLRCFTAIMSSDKLLCVFGRVSPKIALLLSLCLRLVPLFRRWRRESADAQQAMGLRDEEHFLPAVRCRVRVFSAVLTRALENGIITADSMEARGYSSGRRTAYSVFRFSWADGAAALFGLAAAGVVIATAKALKFSFYPAASFAVPQPETAVGLGAFALLCLFPSAVQGIAGLVQKYAVRRSLAFGKGEGAA